MSEELEKELCMRRIALIGDANAQIAEELLKIGYPSEYPEKFKTLEEAYINLRKAFSDLICEEVKVLISLKLPC